MSTKLIVSAIAGLAASTAMAQDYYNQGLFQSAATAAGNSLTGFEDFEDTTPGYFAVGIPEPLTQGVPNGPYPNGLRAPISVYSNLMGDGGLTRQGRGGSQPLAAFEGGNGYSATDSVIANYFVDGLDLVMLGSDVNAIGFNPMVYSGSDTLQIKIFGLGNNLLGTFKSSASNAEKDYFGFVANEPIGRVNLFGLGGNAEGGDNVELWTKVPAPGSAALLGLGGLIAGRRRRA
jgi:hypothetical protein